MTDRLREVFDDMLADEPPLRTDPDEAEQAGRRLRQRHRTLWTITGAALAATLVVAVPTFILPLRSGGAGLFVAASAPSSTGASAAGTASLAPPTAVPATPTAVPAPSTDELYRYEHCPANPAPYTEDNRDGSVLPDPDRSSSAVMASANAIAPGEEFIVFMSQRITSAEKLAGIPQVVLIFDVGNSRGYGSVNLQILPDKTGTPAERAENELDRLNDCVTVQRRDFSDGSVAVYYPYGPASQEAEVTHVWYFAQAGYTMNIGEFPHGYPTATDPNTPATPSSRKPRGSMPLSITQVMQLAHVVANS
jgi:hypothetical protein